MKSVFLSQEQIQALFDNESIARVDSEILSNMPSLKDLT